MLYDVPWLSKVIITTAAVVAGVVGTYFAGYTSGKKDQLLEHQREALQVVEQSAHTALVVQQEMEKTNEVIEHASTVSDDCNFVLNFDLTPCGVLK